MKKILLIIFLTFFITSCWSQNNTNIIKKSADINNSWIWKEIITKWWESFSSWKTTKSQSWPSLEFKN